MAHNYDEDAYPIYPQFMSLVLEWRHQFLTRHVLALTDFSASGYIILFPTLCTWATLNFSRFWEALSCNCHSLWTIPSAVIIHSSFPLYPVRFYWFFQPYSSLLLPFRILFTIIVLYLCVSLLEFLWVRSVSSTKIAVFAPCFKPNKVSCLKSQWSKWTLVTRSAAFVPSNRI